MLLPRQSSITACSLSLSLVSRCEASTPAEAAAAGSSEEHRVWLIQARVWVRIQCTWPKGGGSGQARRPKVHNKHSLSGNEATRAAAARLGVREGGQNTAGLEAQEAHSKKPWSKVGVAQRRRAEHPPRILSGVVCS